MKSPFTKMIDGFMEGINRPQVQQRPRREEGFQYSKIEFSSTRCGGHYDPRVQEIIDLLEEEGRYALFCGRATGYHYTGRLKRDRIEVKHDSFLMRSEEDGFDVEFQIEKNEDPDKYGQIHVLWFRIDPDKQGDFFKFRKLLINDAKHLLLDRLGYEYLYGAATYSTNSTIRFPCSREEDWRNKFHYVGLNTQLQPIILSGIHLLYLRCGFFSNEPFGPTVESKPRIFLFSDNMMKEIKTSMNDEDWETLNQFRWENRRLWTQVTNKRESLLEPKELKRRKELALKKAKHE